MKKMILVLGAVLLGACVSPSRIRPDDDEIVMSGIVAEHVTQPRADVDTTRTFYRMTRGTMVFDVCASDLATALEKSSANGRVIAEDVRLAAKLRTAIAASTPIVLENDAPADLRQRADFVLAEIFQAGGYRVIRGAEKESTLVVGEYSFRRGPRTAPFMGGGVVFFWSKSRRPIFSVQYWIT